MLPLSSWHQQLVNREQIELRGRALINPGFDLLLLMDLFELEKAACKEENDYRRKYRQILQEKRTAFNRISS